MRVEAYTEDSLYESVLKDGEWAVFIHGTSFFSRRHRHGSEWVHSWVFDDTKPSHWECGVCHASFPAEMEGFLTLMRWDR